nr:amidohydrolase family protein [Fulvivirga lutimaris]
MIRKITLLAFILISVQAFGQNTLIYCGQLIDGISDKPQKEMTIIVKDDRIVDVKKGYETAGPSDTVIDLKSKTVMPGLMDMHIHIEGQSSPMSYLNEFTKNKSDIAYDAAVYAKTTLMAGFTTVRDLGGSGVNISLRKAIDAGKVDGPRIYTAGKSIGTTGGHADPTNGYREDLMGDPGPKDGVINGPYEARKAVRQRYKEGSDVIKITSTGGVLSVAKDGSGPQFTMDELKAIVETANDYGMVTAAHAHGPEGMKRAVEAGISSIEHGTLMTPEIMELMKKKGTYYVPTITAGKSVEERAKIPGYFPAIIVPKALAIGPKIQNTFAEAYKAGVKIAFGTDAAVFDHGQNGKEFGYMVEAGMPAMEAIKSATMGAASLLRITDKLGSVEKGKLADIVAVDEDPLKNIKTMENVTFVMKGGKVYKN